MVYGARIRLGWFRKAEELGNVAAACRYYGIPRRTYYYWHERWLAGGNPFGPPKAVTAGGSGEVEGKPASGYSVVNADDQDKAAEMAKGCPMLADSPGAVVEVYEAFPM